MSHSIQGLQDDPSEEEPEEDEPSQTLASLGLTLNDTKAVRDASEDADDLSSLQMNSAQASGIGAVPVSSVRKDRNRNNNPPSAQPAKTSNISKPNPLLAQGYSTYHSAPRPSGNQSSALDRREADSESSARHPGAQAQSQPSGTKPRKTGQPSHGTEGLSLDTEGLNGLQAEELSGLQAEGLSGLQAEELSDLSAELPVPQPSSAQSAAGQPKPAPPSPPKHSSPQPKVDSSEKIIVGRRGSGFVGADLVDQNGNQAGSPVRGAKEIFEHDDPEPTSSAKRKSRNNFRVNVRKFIPTRTTWVKQKDEEEPRNRSQGSEEDQFWDMGILWIVKKGKLIVGGFAEESVARLVGVKMGDILKTVDGQDVLEWGVDSDGLHYAEDLLLGPKNSEVQMSFLRAVRNEEAAKHAGGTPIFEFKCTLKRNLPYHDSDEGED